MKTNVNVKFGVRKGSTNGANEVKKLIAVCNDIDKIEKQAKYAIVSEVNANVTTDGIQITFDGISYKNSITDAEACETIADAIETLVVEFFASQVSLKLISVQSDPVYENCYDAWV